MALLVASWDLPKADTLRTFQEETRIWAAVVKKQPGVKSFHACRKPRQSTSEALALQEFSSVKEALAFLYSDTFASLCSQVLARGCSNIDTKVWDDADVTPLGCDFHRTNGIAA